MYGIENIDYDDLIAEISKAANQNKEIELSDLKDIILKRSDQWLLVLGFMIDLKLIKFAGPDFDLFTYYEVLV